MDGMKKKMLAVVVAALATGFVPGFQESVSACPSCKAANETDARRPRAYMYSILFMLAMPATVFTGFGISFYRLSRKARLAQGDPAIPGTDGWQADGSGTRDELAE